MEEKGKNIVNNEDMTPFLLPLLARNESLLPGLPRRFCRETFGFTECELWVRQFSK